MQPAAEAHDTPVRLSMLPFGAEATLTADHVVPSHPSAIALCRELSSPTARQELAEAHGFEGMLAKRLDSTYQRGRSRDWLKIKHAEYGRPDAPQKADYAWFGSFE